MAIIPRANPDQVTQIQPAPQVRNETTVRAPGGLRQAASSVAQVATDYYEKVKQRNDLTAVMSARRELSDFERSQFGPEGAITQYRGRNALGAQDAMMPELDKRVADIRSRLNPDQQLAFDRVAFSFRESFGNRVQSHMSREHETFVAAEQKATIGNLLNDAVSAGMQGDIGAAQTRLNEALTAQALADEANGVPGELAKLNERNLVSNFHTATMQGMLTRDPLAANEYFERYADQFMAEDRARIERELHPLVTDAAADDILESWRVGGPAVQGDREAVWQTRIKAESGGKQFDKAGNPLTSKAGAIGKAQVMPATAKRVAEQMLGEAFDEARYRNDADYNELLGKTYFNWLWDRFDGNPVLASAAYNAGEGAVDKWLKTIGDPRKGEVTTEEFASRIPYKETREYVKSVPLGDTAPTAGGVPSKADMLDRARQIQDPKLRRVVEGKVADYWQTLELREQEAKRETVESIHTALWEADPNQSLRDILGPEQYAYAAKEGMLGGLAQDLMFRRKGDPTRTDVDSVVGVYWDTFRRDMDAFAKMDVMKNARHMSPSTVKELLKLQDEVRNGKHDPDEYASESQQLDALVYAPLDAKGESKAAKEKRAKFESAWFLAKRDFVKRHGKKPDAEQREALIKRLTASFVLDGETVPFYEAGDAGKVPDAERQLILDAYRRKGLPAPSEDQVRQLYLIRAGA